MRRRNIFLFIWFLATGLFVWFISQGHHSFDDLAEIHQHSQESDLDSLTAQLLYDLEPT